MLRAAAVQSSSSSGPYSCTSVKLSPCVHQQGGTYQHGCTHISFGTGLRAQVGYCNYLCSCALDEDVFLDQNVSKASAGKEDNLVCLYPPSVGKNGVFHSSVGNFGSQCFQQLLSEEHAGVLSQQSKLSRSTAVSSFSCSWPPSMQTALHKCAWIWVPPGRTGWMQMTLSVASTLTMGGHIPRL